MPAFALVDCNNFFASCEQLFDPRLRGVNPTLAAYVAAHDPEWFSIDLGRPG